MSDLIRLSVNYKVDPCDNFYEFACGNWIAKHPEDVLPWDEVKKFARLEKSFQDDMRDALRKVKHSDSKAIAQVSSLYKKCVAAEKEAKRSGVPMISHLWSKIKSWSVFPMLTEGTYNEKEFESKFELSTLFAFFNRNRTVLNAIVPRIIYKEDMPSPLISFYPKNAMFSFLRKGVTPELRESFLILLFKLMKTVAADVGVNYSNTSAPRDILLFVDFMEKLYSIPFKDRSTLLRNENFYHASKMIGVMILAGKFSPVINYAKYLAFSTPTEFHDQIKGNVPVVADVEYLTKVHELLKSTSPRTLTNFAMVHYILSWMDVLEERYRVLLRNFAATVGVAVPKKRSDVCYDEVSKYYRLALLAIYARAKNFGEDTKPIVQEMVSEISVALKEKIENNKWMNSTFKERVIKKIDKMKSVLLFDAISGNSEALDRTYSEVLKVPDLPFISMLDQVAYGTKVKYYLMSLRRYSVARETSTIASGYDDPTNAFYMRISNTIVIPFAVMQYPLFDNNFHRSFNYGSMGSIVAHEIAHAFDDGGILYNEIGSKVGWTKKEQGMLKEYYKKIDCYRKQYTKDKIPVFDINLNGTKTLSENVADNEGLKIVYEAFKLHEKKYGKEPRARFIEDFSSDQIFFLGFAMLYCSKTSDLTLLYGLDKEHSSTVYRVNNVAMNNVAFSEAFFCPTGSKMNPAHKCAVW